MNQEEVMQKVRELAAQIQQSKHPANTLDIALLKAQCVELYEHIQILVPNPLVQEQLSEEIRPLIEQQINAPEPEIVEEKKVPEMMNFVSEPEIKEQVPPPPPPVVVENIPKTVESPALHKVFSKVDKSAGDELSLHERISQSTPKNDLNEKLHAKVENLKSAISLNKKIAFVSQLFKDNTVEYAKSIDKLNASANLDEALRFFSELKHNFNWENDHELVKELQGLIEKRFA